MDACYDSPDYPNVRRASIYPQCATQVTSFNDGFVNAGMLDSRASRPGGLDGRFTANLGACVRLSYLDTRNWLFRSGRRVPNELPASWVPLWPHPRVREPSTYSKGPFVVLAGAVLQPHEFQHQHSDVAGHYSVHPWWLINTIARYDVTKFSPSPDRRQCVRQGATVSSTRRYGRQFLATSLYFPESSAAPTWCRPTTTSRLNRPGCEREP